jgi:fatty-acyl-CoA synthase
MLGLMQEQKLLVSSLIDHAVASHPEAEIVSRTVEGPVHRCSYRDIHRRAKQLANALAGLGVQRGERVATLAWNGYRHMELYFGVSGMGAVLHAFGACSVDSLAVSRKETALLVVPMFHVNAWGMPYAGAMSGARLVLPGPALDGASVYQMLRDERVTLALGVPTVWMVLLQYATASKLKPIEELALRRVVIGGAAAPRAMAEAFERDFGAFVVHAWGMTEMSPVGTVCNLLPQHQSLPLEQRLEIQAKQGRAVFGVSLKLTGADGERLPHDGRSSGNLKVRGPWIARAYYHDDDAPILDDEGYFDTGDVATIDADGYMQITDRAKDVIKSGGEWISSIALENAAMGHPSVAEAAVIGIAHPKWQERPLLLVVVKPGEQLERDAVLHFLATRVAKWWLPDDVLFVTGLPHTATGKLHKAALREQFRDYSFKGA